MSESFGFIAGNLALDFVATVGEWTTTHDERLRTAADLADWIVQAGVLDAAPAPTVGERDLIAARELRDALYALVVALTDRRAPRALPAAEVALINARAAEPPPVVSVDEAGCLHYEGTVLSALSAVARSGLALCAEPERRLIRWCANPTCTRAFLDRSRGHRRRWCGMAGCGDRAKAAAYRRRRRAQSPPSDDR